MSTMVTLPQKWRALAQKFSIFAHNEAEKLKLQGIE